MVEATPHSCPCNCRGSFGAFEHIPTGGSSRVAGRHQRTEQAWKPLGALAMGEGSSAPHTITGQRARARQKHAISPNVLRQTSETSHGLGISTLPDRWFLDTTPGPRSVVGIYPHLLDAQQREPATLLHFPAAPSKPGEIQPSQHHRPNRQHVDHACAARPLPGLLQHPARRHEGVRGEGKLRRNRGLQDL